MLIVDNYITLNVFLECSIQLINMVDVKKIGNVNTYPLSINASLSIQLDCQVIEWHP